MTKKFVRDYESVMQEFKEKGLTEFVKTYFNTDTLIGDRNSIKFINEKIKEYYAIYKH